MTNGARIAMWSGPRNISTAMMRSWGARPDTFVCDEPMYAHYLVRTGLDHPGRDAIIANQETDWSAIVASLTGPIPGERTVYYQKHMAHHVPPDADMDWVFGVRNCFLIREPRDMLRSLARVLPNPTLEETGLPQQVALFERLHRHAGDVPPVIDARDVLDDPGPILRELCGRVDVSYTPAMLHWAPGRRVTDGVWAEHWYTSVDASTGFTAYTPSAEPLPTHLRALCDECRALYQRLYSFRIVPR